jgi:signal transduction histidine kinase
VFHDVTEKREAQQVLKNEFDRMKEIDDMRKNFISTATHELKTPLVSTCGATKFILDNLKHKLDAETLDLVEIIDRGATRLKKLIENLLDFSRIDTKRFDLSLEKTDLIEVIGNAIKESKYHASTRKHDVYFNGPDSLIAYIDAFRIEQLVTNLLSNAIKNTPPGGNIQVKVSQESNEVEISVLDNGVGLTADEKQLIFKKFGKIPRDDSNLDVEIQGSGLGLFISKSIVEAHGGKIWVESGGRNKGSRFIFTIPVK